MICLWNLNKQTPKRYAHVYKHYYTHLDYSFDMFYDAKLNLIKIRIARVG